MNIKETISTLTLDEKIMLLTGASSMNTMEIEHARIKKMQMADGPHGARLNKEDNCVCFPNMCCIGASWDVEAARKMGEALAVDCIEHGIDMLLAPGVNIKRHILCGRNFEYISEDPVVAGEIAAGYINGLQSRGVSASLKHFAVNNQEKYRDEASIEVDLRTLMEIYLKGFEIAVKKASPASVMCAYNKLHSIWCSENKYLLTEVLRGAWEYDGLVVSDWGAVHDPCKALAAGLDLQMPNNKDMVDRIKQGLENGEITETDIDTAAERILKVVDHKRTKLENYDRKEQHRCARELAASGIVLLKNENSALPITKEKYKKIAVIGEFAENPLICGQGSAEVVPLDEYVDSPLEEVKKLLGDDIEISYRAFYQKAELPQKMQWPMLAQYHEFIKDSDVVVMFIGAMESEDTEYFDRRDAHFNPNYELFIDEACRVGKKVIVIMQSGSAMIMGDWHKKVSAIVQMWLGGEAAGGAIADVLTGTVNPSGKLTETFPTVMRKDLEYPGDGLKIEYKERHEIGYRYYDKHPEEVCYPFGHGMSYTNFEYDSCEVSRTDGKISISFTIKNVGEFDGSEVVQIYVSDTVSTVTKSVKELKAFKKVSVNKGQSEKVIITLDTAEFAYYNVLLRQWVTEPGEYIIHIAASAQDIKYSGSVYIDDAAPYTIKPEGRSMIG